MSESNSRNSRNSRIKILLTGPSGFIGAAFTRLALSRGHSVAGLIIPSEQVPAHLPPHPNLSWFRGTLDEAPWPEIQQFKADVCVHTAWVTAPGVYLESPDNYKFLESSIKFLRKVNDLGTNQIVGLGTCIEYQISHQKLSEDSTPILPTTIYSKCKNELRQTLEADAKSRGFNACWPRVFYPYGPREHPSRLCTAIIQKFSRGEKMILKTPDSTKDYIFIEDLAQALLTVVEKQFTGPINLGTGLGISVREIAQTIGKLMGKEALVGEVSPPEIDPLGYVVSDNSRLRSLGWTPKYDLEQGIQSLLKFLYL
jgi:UDP-glucuronate decarboxylase